MLFGADERPGVQSGASTVVFRRWRVTRMYPGRTYRTNVGRLDPARHGAGFARPPDVRKLKNLGVTYCLAVGYRLAPLGAAYLRWLS